MKPNARKRHSLKDKPLVGMTVGELDDCFDRVGVDLNRALLQDARDCKTTGIVVVVALLTSNAAPFLRLVVSDLEYGDGEGIRHIDDFIASVKRCGLLAPGEDLQRMVFQEIPVSSLLSSYLQPGKEN